MPRPKKHRDYKGKKWWYYMRHEIGCRGKWKRDRHSRNETGFRVERMHEEKLELTGRDKARQKKVELEMEKESKDLKPGLEQAVLAGQIPKLDMELMNRYIDELKKLEASGHKGKEEIAKMEVLVMLGQKVMQTLLDMYNNLDFNDMKSKDTFITALKFKTSFFNKWAEVNKEMRQSIESIHRMKYGVRVTTEKVHTIEDDIEGRVVGNGK